MAPNDRHAVEAWARRGLALGALALALVVASEPVSDPVRAQARSAAAWRQWGGPNRNFIVDSTGLADAWPEGGPRTIWSRPLGTGHSAILADGGRLFTMYRKGNGRGRQGPWQPEETIVALDAASGATIWEHGYPSKLQDFSYGAGPHSTPLIVGDRLFAIGTNKELFALETKSGKVIWSHDLVAEFNAPSLLIRPVVKAGYGCSPIAYRDLVVCSVGGPGQSVMAFRQSDGRVAWKSGDFLVSEVAPILITLDGRDQLVVVGGGLVNGLEPATGRILWWYPRRSRQRSELPDTRLGRDYAVSLVGVQGRQPRDPPQAGRRPHDCRGSVVHEPRALHVSEHDSPRELSVRQQRRPRAVVSRRHEPRDRRGGVAASRHRPRQHGLRRWEGDHARRGRRADAGQADARRRHRPVAGEALRHPIVDGADARRHHALRARSGEDRGARRGEKPAGIRGPGSGIRIRDPGKPSASGSDPGFRIPDPGRVPDSGTISGTWQLDSGRSQIGTASLVGLSKGGAPDTLHITVTAAGTIVVESEVNESQSRFYVPNAKSTTPVVPSGTISMTSRWNGRTLVAEGSQESASLAPIAVKESFTAGRTRKTLTVAVTVGSAASTLTYIRSTTVEPCQKWPTPCK